MRYLPYRSLVRRVRDEYELETGERPTKAAAEFIVENKCYTFWERAASEGTRYAVMHDPEVAAYLAIGAKTSAGTPDRKAQAEIREAIEAEGLNDWVLWLRHEMTQPRSIRVELSLSYESACLYTDRPWSS